MKKRNMRRALALMSALPLGVALHAQTAPALPTNSAADANASDADADMVTLDPFTVTAEHEGYQAVDTLAGGRVRTELKDTPAALTVVTSKFLQDLGVTNAEKLLIYTNNTEVSGLGGNFSGLANRGSGVNVSSPAEASRLVNPAGTNRARGLTAMDNTRNYFPSDIPWDGYNISRVDISRGPNSFLFGVGSPSGISNASTNEAMFTDKGNVEVRYGSFGSTRESLDYNKVLIPNELTARIDLVNDKTLYRQEPAYNHTKRAYGALRFDPKFLKTDSAHTKIQANYEYGEVKSNNPRTLPPIDYVTGYLNDPKASATGYNPWTYVLENNQPLSSVTAWTNNGSLGNEYQWGSSPHYYWDAETGSLLRGSQASWSAPTSANYGAAAAGLNNIYHVHTVGYGDYAKAVNYYDPTQYKGAYTGTVTYLDQTLSDDSVYDFYNKLIDGDNKQEWQRWNTYQFSVVQSLFDNRLVIQAVADHQEYQSGQEGFLNSRTPVIVLDLDQYLLTYPSWLSGAETNPNLGRPVTFGSSGSGSRDRSERDNYQVTAAWNLNIERDFGSKGLLARILGRHDFTGLLSRNTNTRSSESYRLYGIDPAWATAYMGKTKLADIGTTWQAYLGPSLLGTTGAGADLSNLATSLSPIEYPMSVYVPTWTAGTSVDPTAAWDYTGPDGLPATLTQADNPANYAGYVGIPASVLNSEANRDQLRTGSNMKEQRITSKAIMYQGHFWDDTIVPSFGVRQDTTRQRGDVATEQPTTGYYSRIDKITDEGVSATTTSRSYGVALHLPKAIKDKLPEGTDLSFYYFHGANQTPTVRYAIDGSQLPNESGKTDDYAVQFDGLNGHLTVRLTYFKTVDKHAAASSGQPLGALGWKIDSIPSWTLGFAAATLAARDNATLPSDFPTWMTGWGAEHPDVLSQIEQTLKTDFVEMFPQTYWDQYNYTVDVEAIKRGDWLNVSTSSAWPSPWTLGGSHQVHGQYAVIDQDIESKGFELEATIRPIKNWDITFNASRASAEQTALGEAASRYLTGMAKLFLDSPLSKVAVWGGYSDYGATKQDFMQNLWAPYLQQVALTGSDQPEWRKLRFNVITNYKFDHSFLKGVNIGGAFRWLDKSIAGYGIHEATVYGETAWISDVNQPIYAPSESHFDLWVGYQRPLTPKIDWRVQLNLRNVGENVGLTPISYQPDGSIAQQRIQEGMTYDLSMKFMF
ncbi:MAG: putative TonB-dependent receptor BfrD precursor [Verrucomicrobia bacterium ADurb.Bin122]|nr:MAG: putative TonB-dependent receptor BfrD precursor [Verrucomicrobia bacterium ADurb.Bin122]